MTEPDQPTLDGLELGEPAGRGEPTSIRRAVTATLASLIDDGLLLPRHAALGQLALEMADAVAAGTRSGKASAAAMAARELRETLLALPSPEAAEAGEAFAQWVESTLAKDPS